MADRFKLNETHLERNLRTSLIQQKRGELRIPILAKKGTQEKASVKEEQKPSKLYKDYSRR